MDALDVLLRTPFGKKKKEEVKKRKSNSQKVIDIRKKIKEKPKAK